MTQLMLVLIGGKLLFFSQMDNPPPSQPSAKEGQKKSSSKKTLRNQTPEQSQANESQKPAFSDVTVKSVPKSKIETEEIHEEESQPEEKISEQLKSIDKPSKKDALNQKNSAKMSQRQKQMEKDEINSFTLKDHTMSGKSLKEGHNNILSNVREYSNRQEREDPPVIAPRTVTTESKKTKVPHSDNKSKTDTKEVKPEKSAIVSTGKRSVKKNENDIPDTVQEEKDEASKSRGLRSKNKMAKEDQENPSQLKSKKRSKKPEDLIQEIEEEKEGEKEESKQNPVNSVVKPSKASKSAMKSVSQVKLKQPKSSLKSAAPSGIKKVKVDSKFKDKDDQ